MLSLTIELPVDGSISGVSVAAEVVDERGYAVWPGPLQLGTAVTIKVPPGRYLAHASLPSGQTARGQADVRFADGTIRLRPERASPHEHWEWAYYITSVVSQVRARPLAAGDVAVLVLDAGQWIYPQQSETLSHGDQIVGPAVSAVVEYVDPNAKEDVYAELRFRATEHRGTRRVWLRAQNRFTAVPLWNATSVLLIPRKDGTIGVVTATDNREAEAILSYLNEGNFGSARAISGDQVLASLNLLQAKIDDPLAAAVGGYFLLRAADLGALEPDAVLHQRAWSENLANWFPWLPDGMVIAGTLALRNGDARRALRAFEGALDRGLPFYTIGLRMLADGLRLLVRTQNADPLYYKSIAAVARKADWTSPTTTLDSDEPDPAQAEVLRPFMIPVGAGA